MVLLDQKVGFVEILNDVCIVLTIQIDNDGFDGRIALDQHTFNKGLAWPTNLLTQRMWGG